MPLENNKGIQQKSFAFFTDNIGWEEVQTKSGKKPYITGYISTDDLDLYNDIVTRDCMSSMMKQIEENNITLDYDHEVWRKPTGAFQHGTQLPVGKVVNAKLDSRGLWVRVQLNKDSPKFSNLWHSVKNGFLNAFSIAFKPLKAVNKQIGSAKVRLLDDLKLINIALTGAPINSNAVIESVGMKSRGMRSVVLKSLEAFEMNTKGQMRLGIDVGIAPKPKLSTRQELFSSKKAYDKKKYAKLRRRGMSHVEAWKESMKGITQKSEVLKMADEETKEEPKPEEGGGEATPAPEPEAKAPEGGEAPAEGGGEAPESKSECAGCGGTGLTSKANAQPKTAIEKEITKETEGGEDDEEETKKYPGGYPKKKGYKMKEGGRAAQNMTGGKLGGHNPHAKNYGHDKKMPKHEMKSLSELNDEIADLKSEIKTIKGTPVFKSLQDADKQPEAKSESDRTGPLDYIA